MENRFLRRSGALCDGSSTLAESPYDSWHRRGLSRRSISARELAETKVPDELIDLIPESIARQNAVFPLSYDGECLTLAAADPEDIATADKLRFILNQEIRLVGAPREAIFRAINSRYEDAGESADSVLQEFTDSAIDHTEIARRFRKDMELTNVAYCHADRGAVASAQLSRKYPASMRGHAGSIGKEEERGMFYYTVDEGQRVLMKRPSGTMEVLVGPKRVWRGSRTFERMHHYVAHPGQFLEVRCRDGRQQHLAGPVELWFDPRIHQEIGVREGLQIAAKEAVVVYTQLSAEEGKPPPGTSRRIVYGPALFVPEPGQWLHTFSWHASKGGSRGMEKVPNALTFQKLWLMPDQMYHDVHDVRTADDAVLTIRLMIFFELVDIGRMLDATHDPIGDFVNAATADVVEFTGKHAFESFKRSTAALNDLATYQQLSGRAAQCGYRISNVVYRGYGAAESLQQMHDQAIEARTKLQLDRATEQQSQELEDFRLSSQLARSARRREEQTKEVRHDLEMSREKVEANLKLKEQQQIYERAQKEADARLQDALARAAAAQQQEHLRVLKEMGVDLTAFLTQSRADRVIELRGGTPAHVHLDRLEPQLAATNGQPPA